MLLSLRQILLYSAGNLGANLVFAFANFAFPLFLSAYAVPQLLVGFLAQERSFVGAFVQPVVGAISDRVPPNRLGKRRPFFLIGVPLTAASLVFLATYPPVWAVVGVMTLFSFFLAVANDPYLALMPDISQSEQRGRIGGVMGVFSMVGAIVVLLMSFLLWEQHQALLFWLVAGGLVACFGVTFFGVREPAVDRPLKGLGYAGEGGTVGAGCASHSEAGASVGSECTSKRGARPPTCLECGSRGGARSRMVQRTVEAMVKRIRDAGRYAGATPRTETPEETRHYVDMGIQVIKYVDVRLLRQRADAVLAAGRAAVRV